MVVSQNVLSQSCLVVLNYSTVSVVQLAPPFVSRSHESGGVDHNTYGPLILSSQTSACGIIDKCV